MPIDDRQHEQATEQSSQQEAALPHDEMQATYSIDQVATRTGMTKRTLRYYEEVGLLAPTGRTEGNYRRYSEIDVQHLKRVKELRDLLGFSLSEIREILDAEDERGQIKQAYKQETDRETRIAQLERSDELIRGQLELIEQKIHGLEHMRGSLLARLERHQSKLEELRNSQ